jgi:hypothetical protein
VWKKEVVEFSRAAGRERTAVSDEGAKLGWRTFVVVQRRHRGARRHVHRVAGRSSGEDVSCDVQDGICVADNREEERCQVAVSRIGNCAIGLECRSVRLRETAVVFIDQSSAAGLRRRC